MLQKQRGATVGLLMPAEYTVESDRVMGCHDQIRCIKVSMGRMKTCRECNNVGEFAANAVQAIYVADRDVAEMVPVNAIAMLEVKSFLVKNATPMPLEIREMH